MKPWICAGLLGLLLVSGEVQAEDSDECDVHYIGAQKAQRAGKLRKAREELQVCLRACSGTFSVDCAGWLSEVDKSQPSVVFRVLRESKELLDVRVRMDGEVLTERLDGKPIALDPGAHLFEVDSGGVSSKLETLIRTGEKNRLIEVNLGPSPAPVASPSSAPAPVASGVASVAPPVLSVSSSEPSVAPRRGPLVLAGAGGVLFVAGAVVGYLAHERAGELRSGCAPRCSHEEVSSVRTRLIVGDAMMGVGVLTLGVAAYWLWGSPEIPPRRDAARWLMWRPDGGVAKNSGFVSISGQF